MPSSLQLTYLDGNGVEKTVRLVKGTDYTFADTGEEEKARQRADGVEISIKPVQNSNYLINNSERCTIKYNIKKSPLNKIDSGAVQAYNPKYTDIDRSILVSGGNEPITVQNIKINVKRGEKTFFLPENEYEIYEAVANSNISPL